ncbi:hypothetical protein JWH16_04535 [Xanthomonas campestris pv. campestris]|uniref:hypothetical protein n=1 Tax=Xanthomonas campestris TaxID=339 RepID=UPI001E58C01B|nr:hypothetical protein [Xanthomonas campestris]MCD0253122.1 hypothetical protein [Xanthomonas campestris pv. campestris]
MLDRSDDRAFTSVTIWSDGDYFLQVHYGYFPSWEAAEDFAAAKDLALQERSSALFLVGPHGDAWVSDQAMQIYRSFTNAAQSTYDMTFDDLLEVVALDDLRLVAIGCLPVLRSHPIVAEAVSGFELSAANDAR